VADIGRRQFELLVERALRRLPRRFRRRLANIAVVVEEWADEETLAEMGIEPPDTLYGLYRGTDLTRRDSAYGNVLPDVITIYRGPIQEDCDSVEEMEELVRDTVVHEIGHYFGLDDARLEELEEGPD
jgi:predicted Zn-dependent protease with MMP-like domain